ncbi:phosphatase PAP2 family protein [Mesorhizobium sp. B4-1-1]|uniref:phosphatase PAP2 family protein n=1 Tax=Mesorhizobium sp. B4-1-1 TaxID=2589890 RepID=UPI001125CC99|nr:phosphatase PAP2 family protein [Mesorhizobium sp. B4-1-1]TPI15510.1 phosphatase PAP2 family protein [Mesorhizobium sp. B4-1-1]
MSAYSRYLVVIVATIGLFALSDAILLQRSAIYLAPGIAAGAARGIALGAMFFGLSKLLYLGMRRTTGALGDAVTRVSEGLESVGIFLMLFFVFQPANGLYMFLAAATQRPLMDGAMAAMDRSIGFNWPAVVEAANSPPLLASVLVASYASVLYQVPLVLIFHASMRGRARFFEFAAILVVALFMTTTMSMLVPTAGAYSYYQPQASSYSHFTAIGGFAHLETLHQLRTLAPFEFTMRKVIGLVSFPSFHTSLGILIVFALRRTFLFWPAVLVNVAMIAATVPEGGHHFMDVIGGAIIAVISISFIRWVGGEMGTLRELKSARS